MRIDLARRGRLPGPLALLLLAGLPVISARAAQHPVQNADTSSAAVRADGGEPA